MWGKHMLSTDNLAAITELRERLRTSIVEGDASGYVACFAEDGVIMHTDTPQVRGRDAIADYAAEMFGMVRVPLLELTPVSVLGSGDFAFEVGGQECEVEPALPGFKRERQHLHVYQRGYDGAWRVAAAMSGNQ
jgi:uncharacterized protein (TIGR02246 family)